MRGAVDGGSRAAAFWKRVSVGEVTSCWRWNGPTSGGYGVVTDGGKQRLAHRFAWVFAYGRIPRGKIILHACDNPACVNPRHLRPGTVEENAMDRTVLSRVRRILAEAEARAAAVVEVEHPVERRPLRDETVPGGPDGIKYCYWVCNNGLYQAPTRQRLGCCRKTMTPEGARYIRDLYIVHGVDLRTIAKVCRVGESMVRAILARTTWRHLPPSAAEAVVA